METDYPERADKFEQEFNFKERIQHELIVYRSCQLVIATTPIQLDMLTEDYGLPRNRVHMIPPGYDDNRFYPVSESSRRMIRQRMGRLRRELEQVRKTRTLHRERRGRAPWPVIALVGYTNAGKSTLFNALVKARAFAADQLFATLDTTTRQLYLGEAGRSV